MKTPKSLYFPKSKTSYFSMFSIYYFKTKEKSVQAILKLPKHLSSFVFWDSNRKQREKLFINTII